jgi:hypothetical protein
VPEHRRQLAVRKWSHPKAIDDAELDRVAHESHFFHREWCALDCDPVRELFQPSWIIAVRT